MHIHKQTKKWEEGYFKTRRDFEKRKTRIKNFNLKDKHRILDLGCGDGLNISVLTKMGMTNIVGVDQSKYLIQEARKKNPSVKFYIGLANSLPFKRNAFDVVLVDSVFHHILSFDDVIKEIKRVLKPEGLLCFIEPHKSILRDILDFVTNSSIGKFIPYIKDRRIAYLEEKPLMIHWLKTENEFYDLLDRNKFKKIFHQYKLLSTLGKYKNSSN